MRLLSDLDKWAVASLIVLLPPLHFPILAASEDMTDSDSGYLFYCRNFRSHRRRLDCEPILLIALSIRPTSKKKTPRSIITDPVKAEASGSE